MDRTSLTKIIESENGINWWKPDLFEKNIKPFLPNELKIVSSPPRYENNFNCFVFIFGLQDNSDFLGGKNPIQQEFIKYLIKNDILIPLESPQINGLILYENEKGEITHGGIMAGKDQVLSKWMWGPIIEHKIWDVPSSFGNKISFFKRPATIEINGKYNDYKNTGVYIKPIR